MVTLRKTGHRLRAGTYTADDITSAYAITARTLADDQDSAEWIVNGQLSAPPERAAVDMVLGGNARAHGFYTLSLHMDYLSFGMTDAWLDDFLANGVYYAPVSGMTYDAANDVVYFNGTLYRPNFGGRNSNSQFDQLLSIAEPQPGGWAITWKIHYATLIAPPAP